MAERTPELSVIVLCYRAGEQILPVIDELEGELARAGVDHELVLVANVDSDDDPTPEIVRAFAAGRPRARVLALRKQGGMGWDMRSGLREARGRVLVVLDGDGQYAAADVVRVYRALVDTGADLSKGRRATREDGVYRWLLTTAYNVVFRVLFPTRGVWDVNGKPKAITREAYESLDLRTDDWFTDAEMVLQLRDRGRRMVDVPVTYSQGVGRPSFVRPGAILQFVVHLLRYRLRGRA